MQNEQLLREIENLKFQIQAQTLSFALQFPGLQMGMPSQLMPDRAYMPPTKPIAQPQTAVMNNMLTNFAGGEPLMKSFQVADGACDWEFW